MAGITDEAAAEKCAAALAEMLPPVPEPSSSSTMRPPPPPVPFKKRWKGGASSSASGSDKAVQEPPCSEPAVQERVEQTDATAPEQEPPCSVPGAGVPDATKIEEKVQSISREELAAIVAEGVRKALEERAAAKQEDGGTTFGVTSKETSREADNFREDYQKLIAEHDKASKQWEAQARSLTGAAETIARVREQMLDLEKDRALRDEERMTECEDERARHAAAEQASQAFAKAGQERFEVLRQKMMEELKNSAMSGFGTERVSRP